MKIGNFASITMGIAMKQLKQRKLVGKMKDRKFYGRHHDLVNHYGITVLYVPFVVVTIQESFLTYHDLSHDFFNKTSITGDPSGAPEFIPVFSGIRATKSLVFCVVFDSNENI